MLMQSKYMSFVLTQSSCKQFSLHDEKLVENKKNYVGEII